MNELYVKLENCFGIGLFEHTFDFRNNQPFLIYAPNGVMKTSFAKTISSIAQNKKNPPCDRVYKTRKTSYVVKADNIDIAPEEIFVIDTENTGYDSCDKITNFLASKELKQQYDSIYDQLDKELKAFLKKLKSTASSTDCEKELIETFGTDDNIEIFSILESLKDELINKRETYSFRYNDIFDPKGKVHDFILKHQDDLQQYFSQYMRLLDNSTILKRNSTGGTDFDTYQAGEIIKSVENDAFFSAGHKIYLNDTTALNNSTEFKNILREEIERIVEDQTLKTIFERIDKAIGGNADLRVFKAVISNNKSLLTKLLDYDAFKKEVWYGFLFALKEDYENLVELYSSKKVELEQIIAKAEEQQECWQEIITVFNARFHVPFSISLKNQKDLILRQETAALSFAYHEEGENSVEQEKEVLLGTLSKGELRAFCILQILFELEARKSRVSNLLIFDDVAESFDYRNKYAIIEYIHELCVMPQFRTILLTHNFDFYRTIASRLCLARDNFKFATKSHRHVVLQGGQYTKNILSSWLDGVSGDRKKFISIIPFARNLIEYMDETNPNFMTLTSCLHVKDNSANITQADVADILGDLFVKHSTAFSHYSSSTDKIFDCIFLTADEICNQRTVDEVLLENKIVLAIACRLKAEIFMLSKLQRNSTNDITRNQTLQLYKEFQQHPTCTSHSLNVLRKVNVMTPEHIHLNSFMYEPLIDMASSHLIALYGELVALA